MPDESRHNPFHALNKALRSGHCRMIAGLGVQDFRDEAASARLMLRLARQLELGRAVAEAQHAALLPQQAQSSLAAAAAACQDQLSQLAALAELQSLLRAFGVATPQRRAAAGRGLYRCYALFVAADMTRMDGQETTLLVQLQHVLDDEGLRALECESLRQLPPDQLDPLLRLALPALPAREDGALLAALERAIEADRFSTLLRDTVTPLLAANSAGA